MHAAQKMRGRQAALLSLNHRGASGEPVAANSYHKLLRRFKVTMGGPGRGGDEPEVTQTTNYRQSVAEPASN